MHKSCWLLQAMLVTLTSLLIACQTVKPVIPQPAAPEAAKSSEDAAKCECAPSPAIPESKAVESKAETVKIADYGLLKPAAWQDVEKFLDKDDLTKAWPAWQLGCSGLKNKPQWQAVCALSENLVQAEKAQIIEFFKNNFNVYQASNIDGSDTGTITGYYQPILKGSKNKTDKFAYPLYSRPIDLITVDLASIFPELANKRVRGRVVGNKLVPYYSRAEIDQDNSPLQGTELIWTDDPIELFFLQIQGSGIIHLENGEKIPVGYADQNGLAYQSIGRLLIDKGELTLDKASMQGIKEWARKHPARLRELLNHNPSYVFFQELPNNLPGPLGALGVPILAERVLAIDPKFIPLGAPVVLSTTLPNNKPLNRLMMAQDTGGAIRGGVRADFYWGAGFDAGKSAGSMKQKGKMWVLLPKEFKLPAM
jgi:membrane-bound lytic murein transglycosylase A